MSQPSWIGYTLGGRYTIEEELGQGGMSAVYKAMDPNLRRAVAVKLIHSHLSSDPEFVRRFNEEAAAVAQLSHPNIVPVFDFAHDDETYYMILEFVPGETLQDRLKRLNQSNRKMPVSEAIEVIAGIADAVEYAHKRDMVHRDIKPANIMINTQGQPVLMDFGVVKILGAKEHTATGAVIGTALYMSPEQVRGERPDQRADIYSLGVTLYEAVSGSPPFEADSAMTTMMMHLNDPVPDIRQLNADTPDGLKAVIEQALAKNPADRFQSAGTMAAALRDVLSGVGFAPAGTVLEQPQDMATAQGATLLETDAPPGADAGTLLEASPSHQDETAGAVGTAAPSVPAPHESAARPARAPSRGGLPIIALLGGGAVVAILVVAVIAIVVLPGVLGGGGDGGGEVAPTAEGGEEAVAVVVPTATTAPIEPTQPPPPTDLPPTEPPAPTVPAGPFVQITDISLEGNSYVVNYEVFGYSPALPGMHIHFFFDSVPPQNAGVPGGGPWLIYAGPIPFRGYTVADRPAAATQMCSLVANPDHSIQLETGNCVALP